MKVKKKDAERNEQKLLKKMNKKMERLYNKWARLDYIITRRKLTSYQVNIQFKRTVSTHQNYFHLFRVQRGVGGVMRLNFFRKMPNRHLQVLAKDGGLEKAFLRYLNIIPRYRQTYKQAIILPSYL